MMRATAAAAAGAMLLASPAAAQPAVTEAGAVALRDDVALFLSRLGMPGHGLSVGVDDVGYRVDIRDPTLRIADVEVSLGDIVAFVRPLDDRALSVNVELLDDRITILWADTTRSTLTVGDFAFDGRWSRPYQTFVDLDVAIEGVRWSGHFDDWFAAGAITLAVETRPTNRGDWQSQVSLGATRLSFGVGEDEDGSVAGIDVALDASDWRPDEALRWRTALGLVPLAGFPRWRDDRAAYRFWADLVNDAGPLFRSAAITVDQRGLTGQLAPVSPPMDSEMRLRLVDFDRPLGAIELSFRMLGQDNSDLADGIGTDATALPYEVSFDAALVRVPGPDLWEALNNTLLGTDNRFGIGFAFLGARALVLLLRDWAVLEVHELVVDADGFGLTVEGELAADATAAWFATADLDVLVSGPDRLALMGSSASPAVLDFGRFLSNLPFGAAEQDPQGREAVRYRIAIDPAGRAWVNGNTLPEDLHPLWWVMEGGAPPARSSTSQ